MNLSPRELGYQAFLNDQCLDENPFPLGTFKQTFIVRHAYNRDFYDFAACGWGNTLTPGCFTYFEKAVSFYNDDPKGLCLIKVDLELYLTQSEERLSLEF